MPCRKANMRLAVTDSGDTIAKGNALARLQVCRQPHLIKLGYTYHTQAAAYV
jgi:hypothetical protein